MRLRTNGEGYEEIDGTDAEGTIYHHRLLAVAEYGIEALTTDDDVHHKTSVGWYNTRENVRIENWYEHRTSHLENGRNIAGD